MIVIRFSFFVKNLYEKRSKIRFELPPKKRSVIFTTFRRCVRLARSVPGFRTCRAIQLLKLLIYETHNFIFIFPGYITNQFNDQLPVGLLAQLVRALHRYRRGQGSNPGKPDFFRLSFRNCISCVNNCEDLLYI